MQPLAQDERDIITYMAIREPQQTVKIYLTIGDIRRIKQKAALKKMPYKKLMVDVVHKYLSGQLKKTRLFSESNAF